MAMQKKSARSRATQRKPITSPKRKTGIAPVSSERRYLTLVDVSTIYGGSTWTWRKRCDIGVLPSVKLAGEKSKILIPRDAVEEFIAKHTRAAVA